MSLRQTLSLSQYRTMFGWDLGAPGGNETGIIAVDEGGRVVHYGRLKRKVKMIEFMAGLPRHLLDRSWAPEEQPKLDVLRALNSKAFRYKPRARPVPTRRPPRKR